MALTVGTQAADAAPATLLMNTFDDILTAANWEEETTRTYTKELMGTVAACRVFVSPSTTNGAGTPVAGNPANITSGTYTGCILTFEIDDTNARVRIRAQEKFRSDLAAPTAMTGVTCVVATDTFTKASHGLAANDIVTFDTFVNITGVVANQPYAVIAAGLTVNDFRVALARASTVINVGGTDGSATVYKVPLTSKWGVYGGSSSSPIFTASYSPTTDNFEAHGSCQFLFAQGASNTFQNAFIQIDANAAGFNYWMGANASRFLICTNSAGQEYLAYGGHLPYSGDLNTSVGNAAVFLMTNILTTSVSPGSFDMQTSSSQQSSTVRSSREPVAGGDTSQAGMCMFYPAAVGSNAGASVSTVLGNSPYGGPTVTHHYYAGNFVFYPMWLHGWSTLTTTSMTMAKGRSNFAKLPEAFTFPVHSDYPWGLAARGYAPNLGELVTASGVTYTSFGMVSPGIGTTAQGAAVPGSCLLIDGSQF